MTRHRAGGLRSLALAGDSVRAERLAEQERAFAERLDIDETLAALDRWRTVRRRIRELERARRSREDDSRQASV